MLEILVKRANWIMTAFGLLIFFSLQQPWFYEAAMVQKAEGDLIDLRYRWRSKMNTNVIVPPEIVLVGLQSSSLSLDALSPEEIAASETLQLMQQPWPWSRKVHAAILEKLIMAHAKVVVFDFVFSAISDGDEVFQEALWNFQNHVVVGSMFSKEQAMKYTRPNASLLREPDLPIVGFVTIEPDFDGVARRAKYVTSELQEYEDAYPEAAKGLGMLDDVKLFSLSAMAVKKFLDNPKFPPRDRDNFIDFLGPKGVFEVLPVEHMFVEQLWNAPPFNGGAIFRDKIVVVGPIAEIFHDIHSTPMEPSMPGPEIQATMINTLLQKSSLRDSSYFYDLACQAVMITLSLIVCWFIRNALIKGALLIVIAAGFFLTCYSAFENRVVVPMTPPLFGLMATGAFGIALRYWLEQLERIRIHNVLERYVSKNVAKAILNDPRSFVESLHGRKQPVTVLFSDIRGFTSMTEGSDAEKLVAQLNEYFQEMVGIVLQEGGTLQKFIGDAIMAVWGDTHSDGLEADARKATRAALRMRLALAKLNKTWESTKDRAQLKIGLGINHGEVIVGNIGHPQRMEFTVLGDGVNLASRLESSTKQFHTDILVGEEAEKLTRDHFVYRRVGAIAFKGKTKPVEVFFLLSDKSQPPPPWLATYHEAVELYRQRCFEAAGNKFEAVQKEIGGEDYLCEMYLQRCAMCLKIPPPEKWDGSFTLTEK